MSTVDIAKKENLLIILLIALLFIMIIIFINPDEQLRKTRDSSREVYATELLRAMTRYHLNEKTVPEIKPVTRSLVCSEIITNQPVADIAPLTADLADWFLERVKQPQNALYVGVSEEGAKKVCYKVESTKKISEVTTRGCTQDKVHYLCVSEQ